MAVDLDAIEKRFNSSYLILGYHELPDADEVEAMIAELHAREKQVDGLVKALNRFVMEDLCPVNEDLAPGFVAGAKCSWGWARERIRALAAVEAKS